jgi:6-pyruvoyltetrahydropterin/6-carboxytetrahydropterin synthase
MSFEVGVVAQFTAQHHLVGDFGPASQPHEHAYRVEAAVFGEGLRADGTLFDITHLQQALAATLARIDGRDLNATPPFVDRNPTAEVVAQYFFDCLVPALSGQGLRRLQTRVWESPEAFASYTGDLA